MKKYNICCVRSTIDSLLNMLNCVLNNMNLDSLKVKVN